MPDERSIRVLLADDNLIVREGVRALLRTAPDIEVVGVAGTYQELLDGADRSSPQVLVTDIRMPPNFEQEGIEAAKIVRKRHPGTGVVVLSQYDEPDYAIALLGEGASGYAYLLKDRVAEGDQLVRAIREVSTGGSMLDPRIVEALVKPVTSAGELPESEEELLRLVAEGKSIPSIAAAQHTTPEAVSDAIEKLFLTLAQQASAGVSSSLRRLKMLHQAIVEREEQGETLSRLLPTGLAEKLRREGRRIGETELLMVTVLMTDVRGYSTIAEMANPSVLAGQLNEHRAEMNHATLAHAGTVMQFVGDSVMAVFGAPYAQEDHADRAVAAADEMHRRQVALNSRWKSENRPAFDLGIGLSTGQVAAALLGSEERVEYSCVGDAVNLAQRIQQLAAGGETVMSEATYVALKNPVVATAMAPTLVKGRQTPVVTYKIAAVTR